MWGPRVVWLRSLVDRKGLLAAAAVMALPTSTAGGTTLLSNTFASSADLSGWTSGSGFAQVTVAPDGGNALTFSGTAGGGDLSSPIGSYGTGSFKVSFDFYGNCGYSTQCGFFMATTPNPGIHWFLSDTPYGGVASFVYSSGSWTHVSYIFSATSLTGLNIENFYGSAHAGYQSFFLRNLLLTDNPPPSSNILSGQTYLVSNLGTTVNPVFQGGTLTVDQVGTVSLNVTLDTSGTNTINQNGKASTFSGVFSDQVAGSPGSIIIDNSVSGGSVTLSGVNSYTGTTTINSGATLALSGSGSIASSHGLTDNGTFDISGTSGTSIASLSGSGLASLGRQNLTLTHAADTFSGIIADGGRSPGSGGSLTIASGSETLTGTNTYTGATTINAGAILVLSGSGSIASSTSVTNIGGFDISASTSTVNIGGSYTQGAAGALLMSGATGAMQRLQVSGAASLDGELGLGVSSGTYKKGSYELIAGTSVTGQFSKFATNLSVYTNMLYALDYRAVGVYLVVGVPDKDHTLAEIARSATVQQNFLATQSARIANALSYDCAIFGPGGVCLSFNSRVSSSVGNSSGAGVLVGAYSVTSSIRIGGLIDYQLTTTERRDVSQKEPQPIFGAFVGYSQDGILTGWQAKMAGAFQNGGVSITRDATLSNTEPGSGQARTHMFGFFGEVGYGLSLDEVTMATPFIGLRHVKGSRNAYSENSTPSSVDYPLSFDKYSQRMATSSLGLRIDGKITDALSWRLGLGVDYDVNAHVVGMTGGGLVSAGASPAYVLQAPASFAVPASGSRSLLHPLLDVGLTYKSAPNQALAANVGLRDRADSSGAHVNLLMGYRMSF